MSKRITVPTYLGNRTVGPCVTASPHFSLNAPPPQLPATKPHILVIFNDVDLVA